MKLKQLWPPTLMDGVKCPNCGKCTLHRLDKRLRDLKRETAWRGGLINLDDFPDISCRNCGAGFEEEEE